MWEGADPVDQQQSVGNSPLYGFTGPVPADERVRVSVHTRHHTLLFGGCQVFVCRTGNAPVLRAGALKHQMNR